MATSNLQFGNNELKNMKIYLTQIYLRERVFVTSSRPFIDKRFAVASCERP